MAADCLTKLMRDDDLQDILEIKVWSSAQRTGTLRDVKARKGDRARQRKVARKDADSAEEAVKGATP